MSSINKVILIGRMGRDPEVRFTPNGKAICNFTLATSRKWKDKTSGQMQEETEWHRLVAFEQLAEIIGKYLQKGGSAYFEGALKTRKWADKEGVEKYTTEVIVSEMKLLGSREEAGEPRKAPDQRKVAQAKQPSLAEMEDDIPF